MGNKEQELSTFFLAFIGQQVTITVTLTSVVNFTDENGNTVETMPVFYEGILLDHDDEYYYLGSTPNEITQAVKKKQVVHIIVMEQKDIYEEILDSMPKPDKKEDVN